ncbi:T9SS type A sorting domain-containing protein, partial [Paludibacteraceae bacterium OttesenSCG-928-F17]|nr:T9SS type A sorting domain-containing protein [Paludibacteraceae bacterium OttesenSCG-928-F17]
RRLAHAGINDGLEKQGQGYRIREVLTNTTLDPIEVQYEFNLEYEGCESLDTITVMVDPLLDLSFETMNEVCWNAPYVGIPYTTANSSAPHQYKLSFDGEGHKTGFYDMMRYDVLPSDTLKINLPAAVKPGRYTVTISILTNACEEEYRFVIWVKEPIVITEQPKSIVGLCAEGSVVELTVTATGDNLTYQWYHNGVAIPGATLPTYKEDYDPSMLGEYYVVVSNECEDLESERVEVAANEIVVGLMWDDVLFVNNGKEQYVAYQWYKDDVAIAKDGNNEYYADPKVLDGKYHVVCFYADGASVAGCPLYFEHVEKSTQVIITPNPADINGTVHVEIEAYEQVQIIEVYTISGHKIGEYKIKDAETQIQAPGLPGTYIIRVKKSSGDTNQQLIVK